MPNPIVPHRRNVRGDRDALASYFSGGGSGSITPGDVLRLYDASVLTLSGGEISITKNYHIIAAQTGSTDDLDKINGGDSGRLLMLQAGSGDTITIKDGTGNIQLNGGTDITLSGDMSLFLFCDGTNWSDISTSGAVQIDHDDILNVTADQHHAGFVGLEDHAGTAVTPASDDRIQFLAANGISVSGGTNTVTFDGSTLDMELMNVVFHQVSWAQFAIYENFHDATKRASPEPSTYPARVYCGTIDNGDDTTADRSFGFMSKTYTDITTVLSSTATAVGENYLEDSAADWFDGQYVNYVLIDSESTAFDITGCTISLLGVGTLTIDGTPAAGAYSIRSKTPTTCVAFCSYLDSTNGGYGHVVLDVSFDGGANWQAVLQTEYSTSLLEGAVTMDYPGHDFCFKASVVNDGDGHGAIIYKVLVVTDPSVWG